MIVVVVVITIVVVVVVVVIFVNQGTAGLTARSGFAPPATTR